MSSGTVHSSRTDQTKATASLGIVLVSRIQFSGPGENFVKWKGTFRSDRPDGWGQVFFLGWEGDPPTLDRFSSHQRN